MKGKILHDLWADLQAGKLQHWTPQICEDGSCVVTFELGDTEARIAEVFPADDEGAEHILRLIAALPELFLACQQIAALPADAAVSEAITLARGALESINT